MKISLNEPEPKPVPGATITLSPQELVLLHVILRKAPFDRVYSGLLTDYSNLADRVELRDTSLSRIRTLVCDMSDELMKALR